MDRCQELTPDSDGILSHRQYAPNFCDWQKYHPNLKLEPSAKLQTLQEIRQEDFVHQRNADELCRVPRVSNVQSWTSHNDAVPYMSK